MGGFVMTPRVRMVSCTNYMNHLMSPRNSLTADERIKKLTNRMSFSQIGWLGNDVGSRKNRTPRRPEFGALSIVRKVISVRSDAHSSRHTRSQVGIFP